MRVIGRSSVGRLEVLIGLHAVARLGRQPRTGHTACLQLLTGDWLWSHGVSSPTPRQ
jgi:hypothetical protein